MRYKRYFPVSHEINHDPEVFELVKRFGAPGLQLWLEILAITDKTENVLKVDNYWLANVSKLVCSRVAKSLQVLNNCIAKGWLVPNKPFESGLEITYSVAKYTEYHRTHSPNSTTLGRENKIIGVPPNLPSPSLTKQKKERLTISPKKCSPHKKADVHMKHDEWFMEFYQAYPKHVAKEEAKTAWDKLCLNEELFGQIMAGVERYKKSEVVQRREGGGAFIKQPGPWLNGKRWDDEGFIPVKAERKFVP